MAVYLRPYENEALPTAEELFQAANLLSDHGVPLALVRAINGEGLVRREFRTRKGRLFLRAFLGWIDFETDLKYTAWIERLPEPLEWRISQVLDTTTNQGQRLRRYLSKRGW